MNSNFSNLSSAMTIQNNNSNSTNNQGQTSQPINISFSKNNSLYNNPRLRRESIAHSQGIGGISWGSVGIGSWLRDEVFLQNQNQLHAQTQNQNQNQFRDRNQSINLFNGNFNNNNAMDNHSRDSRFDSLMYDSIPSSSYLADLEANYCKDYSCCGQILPTLHDLLKHYEEMHIQQDPTNLQLNGILSNQLQNGGNLHSSNSNLNNLNFNLNNNNNNKNGSIGAVPTNEVFLNNHLNTNNFINKNTNGKKSKSENSIGNNYNNNIPDNDDYKSLSNFTFGNNNQFDFTNMNSNSTSSLFQHNALVKDLEDQSKMFHKQVQQQLNNSHNINSNNNSNIINNTNNTNNNHNNNNNNNNNNNSNTNHTNNNNNNTFNMDMQIPKQQVINMSNLTMNPDNDMDIDTQFQMEVDDEDEDGDTNVGVGGVDDDMTNDVCIDNPARKLYVTEQKNERPYKCPVIGCGKTYKNQNGLKYHRLHGHQNQTLRENPDGTLSVINPDSDSPYPNGMGFEKDKPYRCEICGKRYKNLNGLKYHRAHTTH